MLSHHEFAKLCHNDLRTLWLEIIIFCSSWTKFNFIIALAIYDNTLAILYLNFDNKEICKL